MGHLKTREFGVDISIQLLWYFAFVLKNEILDRKFGNALSTPRIVPTPLENDHTVTATVNTETITLNDEAVATCITC